MLGAIHVAAFLGFHGEPIVLFRVPEDQRLCTRSPDAYVRARMFLTQADAFD
jgi:hypothetical protein